MAQSVAERESVTFIGVGRMKLSEWRKYGPILLQTAVVIMMGATIFQTIPIKIDSLHLSMT